MNLENYEKLENGVIRQINVNKIIYDFEYSNIYNDYGEKSNYLSYLRLGTLLGSVKKTPESILDVGYGNCSFLNAAKTIIPNCYGHDISDYPVDENIVRVDTMFNKHYDVVCFFDSLEHFDDINIIDKLDCEYIFISVPWCHNFSDEWFLNWYHRRPNEHLWHFNEESLTKFFNENGFRKIHCSNFEDAIRKNPKLNGAPNILSAIFKKIVE
jgi:hypothetical protein